MSDVSTSKLGTPNEVEPSLLGLPVAASTKLDGGTMVATNASGFAISPATAGATAIWGLNEKVADNSSGSNGDIQATVRSGVFYLAQDGSIAQANIGQNCYAVDDRTVSLSDNGGTRLYAGVIYPPETPATLATTDKVPVFLGEPNAYQVNPELAQSSSTAFKARAVVTTLQAYTGSGTNVLTESSNGAISAADGVALAVGDVVFIQGGTTNLTAALDSGPWTVTALGGASAKWTLTRPDWWTNGSTMPLGAVIDLGGEGTIWAGTAWKSFAAKGSAVVGTNDPTFYVGRVTQAVTLAAGTFTITNVGIKSTSKTNVALVRTATGGTVTSTIMYCPTNAGANGLTAGYIGTGQAILQATVAAGTIASTDTSVLAATVINW